MFTISASNPESKECPYSGKYTISNHRHQRSISSYHRIRSRRENPIDYNHRVNNSKMLNFSLRNISDMPIMRSRRQSNDEISCINSVYNKLEVGCNTAKNMEFYSTCDNKELVTGTRYPFSLF